MSPNTDGRGSSTVNAHNRTALPETATRDTRVTSAEEIRTGCGRSL
jgi:hypothetical protein